MDSANDDLFEAKDRLAYGRFKYATINSYYSIFHAARALLYSRGYRERSHYCLSVALEILFVQNGLMEERFIRTFNNAMALREEADYIGSFSEAGSVLIVKEAEEFLQAVRNALIPYRL